MFVSRRLYLFWLSLKLFKSLPMNHLCLSSWLCRPWVRTAVCAIVRMHACTRMGVALFLLVTVLRFHSVSAFVFMPFLSPLSYRFVIVFITVLGETQMVWKIFHDAYCMCMCTSYSNWVTIITTWCHYDVIILPAESHRSPGYGRGSDVSKLSQYHGLCVWPVWQSQTSSWWE